MYWGHGGRSQAPTQTRRIHKLGVKCGLGEPFRIYLKSVKKATTVDGFKLYEMIHRKPLKEALFPQERGAVMKLTVAITPSVSSHRLEFAPGVFERLQETSQWRLTGTRYGSALGALGRSIES